MPGGKQQPAHIQSRRMAVDSDALGRADVVADQLGVDRRAGRRDRTT
jgi:hypothetical protein